MNSFKALSSDVTRAFPETDININGRIQFEVVIKGYQNNYKGMISTRLLHLDASLAVPNNGL
jgi:hypothetical protein